eukprot:TRINITY_DN29162_c0_g1_i1.p1 TRINITY_DN29162_c0_g1~~TRINITY_DN29162_c0_g1_i1.p1  ORF type:complete len:912 (+),score=159.98 TRINITY_DN29162_c0_g1_i1:64-2799(+)
MHGDLHVRSGFSKFSSVLSSNNNLTIVGLAVLVWLRDSWQLLPSQSSRVSNTMHTQTRVVRSPSAGARKPMRVATSPCLLSQLQQQLDKNGTPDTGRVHCMQSSKSSVSPRQACTDTFKPAMLPTLMCGRPHGLAEKHRGATEWRSRSNESLPTPAHASPRASTKQVRRPALQGQSLPPSRCAALTIVQLSTFDADVRCAARVVVTSQNSSVWCSERDGSLSVRDPLTQHIRAVIPQDKLMEDYVWSILQDGDAVWVGMSSGRMRIYSASTLALLVERIRHSGGIYALATLGKHVYSASNDFTILEWDREERDCTNRILGEHVNQVRCLCACAGRLVSGGDDHCIYVWDLGRSVKSFFFTRKESILAVVSARSSPLGGQGDKEEASETLWAGDAAGELSMFDIHKSTCVGKRRNHAGAIYDLVQDHGFIFSASADKTVKIWDPAARTCLQTIKAHASYVGTVLPVAVCEQIRFWSCGGDKTVRSWSMDLPREGTAFETQALQDKVHHQGQQLAEMVKQAEAAESQREKELLCLSASHEEERRQWSASAERQRTEMERLVAALASCEDKLQQARQELDVLRQSEQCQKANLDQLVAAQTAGELELDQAQLDLQKSQQETATLERDSRKLRDMLLAEKLQHDDAVVQLQACMDELHDVSRQHHTAQETLQETRAALSALEGEAADMITNELDALKTSRLGFVTAVWALHKRIAAAKPVATKTVVCTISRPAPRRAATTAFDGAESIAATSLFTHYRMSKNIIEKYLTDDEKLHLGIPLAHFEGGHDSPKPLNWSELSDDSTVPPPSPDCSPESHTHQQLRKQRSALPNRNAPDDRHANTDEKWGSDAIKTRTAGRAKDASSGEEIVERTERADATEVQLEDNAKSPFAELRHGATLGSRLFLRREAEAPSWMR